MIVAVFMALGCLMVIIGFMAPFIAEPAAVTGYDLFKVTLQSIKAMSDNSKELANAARFLGPDAVLLLSEVFLILAINGIALGLLTIGCAYAVLKYVATRKSAIVAISVPVGLAFLSLVYAFLRLQSMSGGGGRGNQEATLVLLSALSSLNALGGGRGVMQAGIGLYLYPIGMLLALVGTNFMWRIEKRWLKRARQGELPLPAAAAAPSPAAAAAPPPAPVPSPPAEPSGPSVSARVAGALSPVSQAFQGVVARLRSGLNNKRSRPVIIGVAVVVVALAVWFLASLGGSGGPVGKNGKKDAGRQGLNWNNTNKEPSARGGWNKAGEEDEEEFEHMGHEEEEGWDDPCFGDECGDSDEPAEEEKAEPEKMPGEAVVEEAKMPAEEAAPPEEKAPPPAEAAPAEEALPEPEKTVPAEEAPPEPAEVAPAEEKLPDAAPDVEIPPADLVASCSSADKPVKVKTGADIRYDASVILDDNLETAWIEGVDGDGIGEWIELQLPAETELTRLVVRNGYQKVRDDKYGDRYLINQRVRDARITVGGGAPFSTKLVDDRGPQNIDLGGRKGDRVRLEIASVYGAKYADTAICEVRVYGRQLPQAEKLDTGAIAQFVEDWARAQTLEDFDAYAAAYDYDFSGVKRTKSGGEHHYTRSLWLEDRRKMFKLDMTVYVRDLAISSEEGPDSAVVVFTQFWKTKRYGDQGKKELRLVRRGDDWRIQGEDMLDSRKWDGVLP